MIAAAGSVNPLGTVAAGILVTVTAAVFIAFYLLPSIIAWRRHVPALGQVIVVNLFLGVDVHRVRRRACDGVP